MSLYVLDTDILTLYERRHPLVCQNVASRSWQEVAITIISVEEQINGWYALIRRARRQDQIARAYQAFLEGISFVGAMPLLSFAEPAIQRFQFFRTLKLGVGSMDLRISAIAMEYGATVVTRNVRDFGRVPGLAIEDWSV